MLTSRRRPGIPADRLSKHILSPKMGCGAWGTTVGNNPIHLAKIKTYFV